MTVLATAKDNASFHLEHSWISFLEKDLAKLLAIEKT